MAKLKRKNGQGTCMLRNCLLVMSGQGGSRYQLEGDGSEFIFGKYGEQLTHSGRHDP